jgi:hypothetical protein
VIVNLKLVFVGAVEGILFCTAILMLGVVARHALADGPGGGVLCVPVDPGKCDRDCCNRCIYRQGHEWPDGYFCDGYCKWGTFDPCDKCQAACDQNLATENDGSKYCACLEL